MKEFIVSALVGVISLAAMVPECAQSDPQGPKGFYVNGFVEKSPEGKKIEARTRAANSEPVNKEGDHKKKRIKKREIVISVYVNSLDKPHFNRVIGEVLRLHDEKIAFILGVTHMGDYQAITPEVEGELARRGIRLFPSSDVAADVPVTASPAWVIRTRDGVHIAEGVIALHSLIDEWGEYQTTQGTQPTPQLQEQVEGF